MADYSYILLNKSPLQLRLIGARGGRAYGRNLRARRALLPTPPPADLPRAAQVAPPPTTAEAVALLDTRFPWLRGAEKRHFRKQFPDLNNGGGRLFPGTSRVAERLVASAEGR